MAFQLFIGYRNQVKNYSGAPGTLLIMSLIIDQPNRKTLMIVVISTVKEEVGSATPRVHHTQGLPPPGSTISRVMHHIQGKWLGASKGSG